MRTVGTMKSFELHPDIDPALFPPIQPTLAQEIAIPDICTAELEEFFDNGNGSTPTVMKAKPSPAPSRRLFSRFPQTKQPDPDEYDDPEFLAAGLTLCFLS